MFDKINYKLIITHALAGFFLLWAVRELIYLYDSELLRIYDEWDFIDAWRMNDKAERLGKFLAVKLTGSYVAILVSLFISLIITIKTKAGALNSVIVFILTVIFLRLNLLTNDYVESVVYFPGEIIYGFSVKSVTFNGIVLLIISFLIYFLKALLGLITKKDQTDNDASTEV
jgi:hypothetical protein